MNRRVLIAASRRRFSSPQALSELFEPFGWHPQRLQNPRELTQPGEPLYMLSGALPPHLLLLDTPDFDTGAKGVYANREAARQALELADLMLYIFTNSNYANRDNTDFVAEMLTGVGQRKAFLVYRAYPSFDDVEVGKHAMTVARNIYGSRADDFLMGIYRADEDNRVAAGLRPMSLAPLATGGPSLAAALTETDPVPIRLALFSSVLQDVVDIAGGITDEAGICLDELKLYRNALLAIQAECLQIALRHFPLDTVMRRFARIWSRGDPVHIRAMRKTGSFVSFPVKVVSRMIKSAGLREPPPDEKEMSKKVNEQIQSDLLTAANRLYEQILSPRINVSVSPADPTKSRMRQAAARIRRARKLEDDVAPQETSAGRSGQQVFSVEAPVALNDVRKKLRQGNWENLAASVLARSSSVVDFSRHIDSELEHLADTQRSQMNWRAKITQTFAAFLNVLPATAAVTYILSTGDPVGAAGIKIKLGSLFGLHDLYALVALPATSGLKKADRRQLENLLAPVARVWLDDKVQLVRRILEDEISGPLLDRAKEKAETCRELITQLEEKLTLCRTALIQK